MRLAVRRMVLGAVITSLSSSPLRAQGMPISDSLPPGVTAAMIERGKIVFEGPGLCFNCHGADAHGLIGPNLTDSDWWHVRGSYLSIVEQIMRGVPAERSVSGAVMPPRGGSALTDAEVQAVASYVWKLSHPAATDSLPLGVSPAMIEQGRVVFTGRGNCATCHGQSARGNLGPDLTDENWLHAKGSYLAILSQILTGVPAERSRSGIAMEPRGGSTISNDDVLAVAAYVWALSHRDH